MEMTDFENAFLAKLGRLSEALIGLLAKGLEDDRVSDEIYHAACKFTKEFRLHKDNLEGIFKVLHQLED